MDRDEVIHLITTSIDPSIPFVNRRLPKAKNGTGGRTTNLPQAVWFEFVFELNEKNMIIGNYDKVMTDKVILSNWAKEYENLGYNTLTGQKIGGALSSGRHSIGLYRRWCRLAKLYEFQLKPILMSFRYSRPPHPCKEKTKALIPLTLDQCRELCLEFKIADPRYFSPKEIADIAKHAEKKRERSLWGIPSKTQWQELDDSVPGGIYGRHNIYNTPYTEDWSPLTW